MDEIKELIVDTEERASAIFKLLRLIELDTQLIAQYRANAVDDLLLRQYQELRNENIQRLMALLSVHPLKVQITLTEAS